MNWPVLPPWGVIPAPAPTPIARTTVEGQILLSASQADTFNDCERKWGFEKLDRIPKTTAPSAQLGTRVHHIAEPYLLHGTLPDLSEELQLPKGGGYPGLNTYYPGQIFDAGRHFLPKVGTVHVEGRKTWVTPGIGKGPIHWQGQLDGFTIRMPNGQTVYPYRVLHTAPDGTQVLAALEVPEGARLEVWDHKTTSDYKYMRHLPTDIQGNVYAWASMEEFAQNLLDARWLYYRTKGRPDSRLSSHTYHRSQVAEQINRIDHLAAKMLTLYAEKPAAKDLTPNPATCGKYGGCPYTAHCPLTISQRFSNMTTTPPAGETLDQLIARTRNAQANGSLPPPGSLEGVFGAAAPVPTPAPTPAPAPAQGKPMWQPGAPLSDLHKWMISQPTATWSSLAQSADQNLFTIPPPEMSAQFDAMLLPPHQTNGQPVPRGQAAPSAPAPTPSAPPAPGAAVQVGINPGDAPAFAPTHPEAVPERLAAPASTTAPTQPPGAPDMFEGCTRDMLKAMCVQRGLCTSSYRGTKLEPFKQALLTGVKIPEPGEAPAAPSVPPPAQMALAAMPDPTPAPSAPPPAPTPAPVPSAGGYTLYVYCMPVQNPTGSRLIRFSEICAQVMPRVSQATGAPHYSMVDFGKGRGVFSAIVEEFLTKTGIGKETGIVVDRTPEATDALSVLERHAGAIIRGL